MAAIVGAGPMLGSAAAYAAVSCTVVLSVRTIRSVTQPEPACAASD